MNTNHSALSQGDGNAAAEVRLLASQNNWIEGSAVQQLEKTASLPGMLLAVGLPDLHPGKGSPIGAAFAAQGWLYPALVGNDIGCGIGLWRTSLSAAKIKREAWAEKLRKLDGPWEGDAAQWLAVRGIAPSGFESSLGTIGSGNHFAELQAVERIENAAAFADAGLSEDRIFLLVHSGSRGLGESILRHHTDILGAAGLEDSGEQAGEYLRRHDHAVRWARPIANWWPPECSNGWALTETTCSMSVTTQWNAFI